MVNISEQYWTGVKVNGCYQYTTSIMVPKNLHDWYQNCNTSPILIIGGVSRDERIFVYPSHYLGQYLPNNKLVLRNLPKYEDSSIVYITLIVS